jgi:uncharacterized protein YhaN
MPVRIEEINVHNLGPITNLQAKLGALNLFYGKNERGKTYLVEFIIQSLFKTTRTWKLRNLAASGQISVSGLDDIPVFFAPSSTKKLEDYLGESYDAFPSSISRLLVVKGAELELIEDLPGGINRTIIREYLSREATLDAIQSRISKTLQKATLDMQAIVGDRMGEISQVIGLENDLEAIDDLFSKIDEQYSGGERLLLAQQLESMLKQIEKQKLAKRHQAFQLAAEIVKLENKSGNLTQESINRLHELNQKYKTSQETIQNNQVEIETLKKDAEDYEWLKHAVAAYKDKVATSKGRDRKYPAVIAELLAIVAMLVLAGVWSGYLQPLYGYLVAIGAIGLAAILWIIQIWWQSKVLKESFSHFEGVLISAEFESRFGKKAVSMASMEATMEKLQSQYYKRYMLLDTLPGQLKELESIKNEIVEELKRLERPVKFEGPWDKVIEDIERDLAVIEKQRQHKEIELSGLNIAREDYLDADPGCTYDLDELVRLETQASEIENHLEASTNRLKTLKQMVCTQTGDDISIAWPDLIESLQTKRAEIAEDYRSLRAEIVAKILVNSEVCDTRDLQDQRIQEILDSELISAPLFEITHRYNKLELDGEQLVVSDAYNRFHIAELSTGAQEQVLLALRIACTGKITGKDHFFLILDDAFQHADWERRGWMIEKIVSLAANGWQIIYLTMDDHIKQLFQQKGKRVGVTFFDLEEFSTRPN